MTQPEAERVARLFHETYERLAPTFGYETRADSAVPWEQVPETNKRLMIAVAAEVLRGLTVLTAEQVRMLERREAVASENGVSFGGWTHKEEIAMNFGFALALRGVLEDIQGSVADKSADGHRKPRVACPSVWLTAEDRDALVRWADALQHNYLGDDYAACERAALAVAESVRPPKERYDLQRRRVTRCQSDDDGHCVWRECPQLRDGEPERSGRHCPLDQTTSEGDGMTRSPTGCRRCSECVGQDHHFLQPDWDEEDERAFVPCKHCEFEAPACDECLAPVHPVVDDSGLCVSCKAGA